MDGGGSTPIDKTEVDSIANEAIKSVLGSTAFVHSKVDGWSSKIMENCLKRLASAAKPFKYVVTCKIVQNAGAGIAVASTTFWDPATDDQLTVQWENNSTSCICTVYWLAR